MLAKFEVLINTSGQVPKATVSEQRILLVGNSFEQIPVVANHNQCARPPIQEVFHCSQDVGVEVVGRLVQDEHIRLAEEKSQELEPASLTTRQILDWSLKLRLREAELFNQLADSDFLFVNNKERLFAGNQAENALAVELIELADLLAKCGDVYSLTALNLPGCWLEASLDELQQRGLSSAVDANQSNAVART